MRFFATLLILAPSSYMLEVYDRVVNSGSNMALAMLTLLVAAAFVLLEWATAEIMHEDSLNSDRKLSGRVFAVIFESNLKRLSSGTAHYLNDFRSLRDFFHASVLLARMQAPVSLVFLLLIFVISPVLGWSAVVVAILQTFVGWLNERSTQPPLLEANQSAVAALHTPTAPWATSSSVSGNNYRFQVFVLIFIWILNGCQ